MTKFLNLIYLSLFLRLPFVFGGWWWGSDNHNNNKESNIIYDVGILSHEKWNPEAIIIDAGIGKCICWNKFIDYN